MPAGGVDVLDPLGAALPVQAYAVDVRVGAQIEAPGALRLAQRRDSGVVLCLDRTAVAGAEPAVGTAGAPVTPQVVDRDRRRVRVHPELPRRVLEQLRAVI